MALQSSGQISFFDVVLEHRPNNTTVGSGLKPFRLAANYNSYSTSVSSPLTLKEFYGTSSSYNTSRYDNSYTGVGNATLSWAASVGDIKEIYLFTNSFSPDPGSETTAAISLTNGGTYKLRYFVNSNSSNAAFVIGHGPSNSIYPSTLSPNGFFGPFTPGGYVLSFSATSTYDSLAYLYARIIRIA